MLCLVSSQLNSEWDLRRCVAGPRLAADEAAGQRAVLPKADLHLECVELPQSTPPASFGRANLQTRVGSADRGGTGAQQ